MWWWQRRTARVSAQVNCEGNLGVRVVAFKLRLKLSVTTHFQQKVGHVKPFSGHIIWF
jgi:hypothetical protein